MKQGEGSAGAGGSRSWLAQCCRATARKARALSAGPETERGGLGLARTPPLGEQPGVPVWSSPDMKSTPPGASWGDHRHPAPPHTHTCPIVPVLRPGSLYSPEWASSRACVQGCKPLGSRCGREHQACAESPARRCSLIIITFNLLLKITQSQVKEDYRSKEPLSQRVG